MSDAAAPEPRPTSGSGVVPGVPPVGVPPVGVPPVGVPPVGVATSADRDRVVRTVVAAFDADPAFRYFFTEPTTFAGQASTFAAYLFDKRVSRGTVWVVDGGAAAVSMWDPPSASSGPPTSVPTSLSVPVSLQLPPATMGRLDAYEAAVHDAIPTEPHWYLGVLASHPAHAGRRLGRAVMAAGLSRARADGVPAYLETTNPRNVGLYERSGWRVTAERVVGQLSVWVMRHYA